MAILVPRLNIKGIPESMVCRVPMFMWSLEAPNDASISKFVHKVVRFVDLGPGKGLL